MVKELTGKLLPWSQMQLQLLLLMSSVAGEEEEVAKAEAQHSFFLVFLLLSNYHITLGR